MWQSEFRQLVYIVFGLGFNGAKVAILRLASRKSTREAMQAGNSVSPDWKDVGSIDEADESVSRSMSPETAHAPCTVEVPRLRFMLATLWPSDPGRLPLVGSGQPAPLMGRRDVPRGRTGPWLSSCKAPPPPRAATSSRVTKLEQVPGGY